MEKIFSNQIRRIIKNIILENEYIDADKQVKIKNFEDGLRPFLLHNQYGINTSRCINAVIGVQHGLLKWYSGTLVDETWNDGIWLKGTFYGGIWKNGTFHNGTFEGKLWQYGTFAGGIFNGGTWEDGIFKGGTFDGEKWEDGLWIHGEKSIWKSGKWVSGIIKYIDKDGNLQQKKSFVNPNEFFKGGGDEAEYNIEQDGNYFIVTYKDYKGEEKEKIFRSKEAAENFAKNL
jgi:hypothetical protein